MLTPVALSFGSSLFYRSGRNDKRSSVQYAFGMCNVNGVHLLACTLFFWFRFCFVFIFSPIPSKAHIRIGHTCDILGFRHARRVMLLTQPDTCKHIYMGKYTHIHTQCMVGVVQSRDFLLFRMAMIVVCMVYAIKQYAIRVALHCDPLIAYGQTSAEWGDEHLWMANKRKCIVPQNPLLNSKREKANDRRCTMHICTCARIRTMCFHIFRVCAQVFIQWRIVYTPNQFTITCLA